MFRSFFFGVSDRTHEMRVRSKRWNNTNPGFDSYPKANSAVNTALSGTGIDIDMRIGMVNDAKYGGCGGQWAVLAGANNAAP